MDSGRSTREEGDNLIRANKEAARAIVAIINLVVRCLPSFFLSSLGTSVATSFSPLYARDVIIKENAGNRYVPQVTVDVLHHPFSIIKVMVIFPVMLDGFLLRRISTPRESKLRKNDENLENLIDHLGGTI